MHAPKVKKMASKQNPIETRFFTACDVMLSEAELLLRFRAATVTEMNASLISYATWRTPEQHSFLATPGDAANG
jgi:hypothetical protein